MHQNKSKCDKTNNVIQKRGGKKQQRRREKGQRGAHRGVGERGGQMHHIARRKLRVTMPTTRPPRCAGSPTRVGAQLESPPSIVRFDTAKIKRHINQGCVQLQRRPDGVHVGHVKLGHRQVQLGQVRVVLQRLGPRGHGSRRNDVQRQRQRGARAVTEKKKEIKTTEGDGRDEERAHLQKTGEQKNENG